ncbi:hypothetical protein NDU88_008430 [Pleurodeles waltl]|uniref:Uncharacterized protein n=1 Tax=Pleurodeles waltl TaxID=8319 RepID=A0AAV7QPP5_PLEWA|nr:hypothetical protein NDU88_008430 [Pleurodeles waltl]
MTGLGREYNVRLWQRHRGPPVCARRWNRSGPAAPRAHGLSGNSQSPSLACPRIPQPAMLVKAAIDNGGKRNLSKLPLIRKLSGLPRCEFQA